MKITAISDLHGFKPKLPSGDLLLIAGDLTASDSEVEHRDFLEWLSSQDYRKVIYIPGNHDTIYQFRFEFTLPENVSFICDSGTEFDGLKLWGTPWSLRFATMNPKCMAFTELTESDLLKHYSKIPNDTDILITHTPPRGILDNTNFNGRVGSVSLRTRVDAIKPKLIVFGHIHESYGKQEVDGVTCINASYVNEKYKPVNKNVEIEL